MNLCAHVSEERGNGEGEGSQALSLLSDTRRCISLADLDRGWVFFEITNGPVCTYFLQRIKQELGARYEKGVSV